MTIQPGYGIDDLHLGETKSELRAMFGKPKKKIFSGKLREHWRYPQAGLECVVSRQTGRILSIFFTRHSMIAENSPGFEYLFDASPDNIRTLYSDPDLEGGGFQVSGGPYVGRWYSYHSGIGFHFDRTDHVETIAVFRRRRKVRAKIEATHELGRQRQVAALRNP